MGQRSTWAVLDTLPRAAANSSWSHTTPVLGGRTYVAHTAFGQSSTAYGSDMALSLDGTLLFLAGTVYPPGIPADFGTVAYDAATGAKLWAAQSGGSAFYDYVRGIAVAPDGTAVYVTGSVGTSNRCDDFGTVAYDAAGGTELWARTQNGATNGCDYGYAVAVSPDGSRCT
jgi:hypothetical protein